MNIIITGGAGFVGRNLVRILTLNNYDITVLDKSVKNLGCLTQYNIKTLCEDLADKGDWSREFEGKDVVINLEAQISSPEYDPFYRNNIIATKNVIEAARKAGVNKFIHFSSAAVLSIRKDDYAKTKSEGEELVKNSGMEYCILQPSIMYGPTDDKNIGFLINFAKKIPMFPIPGHGKWPRQPIYIDDMCYLIVSIMNNFPHNKVYSINGKDIIYYKDMIKIVLKEIGGFKFRLFLPISLFKFLMMSYQKLTGNVQFTPDQVDSLTSEEIFPNYPWWDEFNIKITSFEEGVRRMME
ncbi:MAG: NAD-dependent epimerase/dehydratase family protein [ANME-2 cluster archaeon]|jgi:nucleoside-diphosphate-sugar epimerase|nr:NAD-dependent epimerase/dehydratase family protein [ANME-2 cluster archaeon]